MRSAYFMNKGHEFRFSAALVMLAEEGQRSLRVGKVERGVEEFVGADVGGWLTAFRTDEVDDIKKVAERVDSLPRQARDFVDSLQACADHIKEERAARKERMI
jgi:hypothetical protein